MIDPQRYVPNTSTVLDCFLDGAEGNFVEEDFEAWLEGIRKQVLEDAANKAFKDKSIQGLARVTIGNWLRFQNPKEY